MSGHPHIAYSAKTRTGGRLLYDNDPRHTAGETKQWLNENLVRRCIYCVYTNYEFLQECLVQERKVCPPTLYACVIDMNPDKYFSIVLLSLYLRHGTDLIRTPLLTGPGRVCVC